MKSLEDKTLQQIFDQSYNGLKSQGFVRAYGNFGCCYRTPDGENKCAVGHLIADDEYRPEIENTGIHASNLAILSLLDRLGVERDSVKFELLKNLQSAHDVYPDPKQMQEALERVARKFRLEVPE